MSDKSQSVGKGGSPTLRESNPAANEDVMKHGTRSDEEVAEPGTRAYGPVVEEGHRERQARADAERRSKHRGGDNEDSGEARNSRAGSARDTTQSPGTSVSPQDPSLRETAGRVGGIPSKTSGDGLSGQSGAGTSVGGSAPGKDAG
jgi:hypothetical protein